MSMHGYVFVRECVLRDYVRGSEATVANKVHLCGHPAAERSSERKVWTEVKRKLNVSRHCKLNIL